MRHLRIARSADEVESLRPLWEHLDASAPTLFQTYAWNHAAAGTFADREAPFVVAAESDSGAAIVPACIVQTARGRELRLMGEELFDYRSHLHAGDPAMLDAAWEALAPLGLPLTITAVREPAPGPMARLPRQPFVHAPALIADRTSEQAFVSAHNRSGSRLRKLQRLGVECHGRSGAREDLLRAVYERKAAQSTPGAPNLFRDPRRAAFMLGIAGRQPHAVEMFTFEQGGALLAALVTLRDRNVRRFYTTWFDPAWSHYSPGTILLYEATRRTLAQGMDCDYMTGEQSYKLRLANERVPLSRVEATAEELHRSLASAVASAG